MRGRSSTDSPSPASSPPEPPSPANDPYANALAAGDVDAMLAIELVRAQAAQEEERHRVHAAEERQLRELQEEQRAVQARVLEIFTDLQREHGFGCLFVSHDLAVVEQLSDRIAVMKDGLIVEQGTTAEIIGNPQHEYTRKLIAAVPVPDPKEQERRREAANA